MAHDDGPFSIGQLARRAGCRVETVHYYERTGLMPEPPRSRGGHRVYGLSHLKRLSFIRRCRELGFAIDSIRDMLRLIDEPGHFCGEVKAVATKHAAEVAKKMMDLQRLQVALEQMISRCQGEAWPVDECPIIDALYQGVAVTVTNPSAGDRKDNSV